MARSRSRVPGIGRVRSSCAPAGHGGPLPSYRSQRSSSRGKRARKRRSPPVGGSGAPGRDPVLGARSGVRGGLAEPAHRVARRVHDRAEELLDGGHEVTDERAGRRVERHGPRADARAARIIRSRCASARRSLIRSWAIRCVACIVMIVLLRPPAGSSSSVICGPILGHRVLDREGVDDAWGVVRHPGGRSDVRRPTRRRGRRWSVGCGSAGLSRGRHPIVRAGSPRRARRAARSSSAPSSPRVAPTHRSRRQRHIRARRPPRAASCPRRGPSSRSSAALS